jgi:hypothetical protein
LFVLGIYIFGNIYLFWEYFFFYGIFVLQSTERQLVSVLKNADDNICGTRPRNPGLSVINSTGTLSKVSLTGM